MMLRHDGLRVIPRVGDWWSRTADSSSDDISERRVDEAAPLLLLTPAAVAAAAGDGSDGDFDAVASVACWHRSDYDQAGICVRISAKSWLKANVERMPDGRLLLACCVCNGGFSDWSCSPLDERCGGGGVSASSLFGSATAAQAAAADRAAGGIFGASAAIRLRVRRRRGDYSVEWAPPPPPPTPHTAKAKEKAEKEEEEEEEPPSFTRFRLCRLHEDDGGVESLGSLRVGVYASAPVAPYFEALFRSLKVGPPASGPLL